MLAFKAVLILLATNSAVWAGESDISKFMKHLGVIPDLIDEGPEQALKINYDSGVTADKGVELTPTQVKNEPKVEWQADSTAFYTLIMTDPDAPSRQEPTMREFQHWIVGNIPGNAVDKGDVLAQYIGSGPPKGTGLHRYVFLIFKQPSKLEFTEKPITNTSAEGHGKFSTRAFAAKYGLGTPVAGNFYQAEYDDYVPILYKQLGA